MIILVTEQGVFYQKKFRQSTIDKDLPTFIENINRSQEKLVTGNF